MIKKNKKSLYSKQFVQEAVLQCVQRLSEQQPDIQVGLITFNHQVCKRSSGAWSKDNCPVFTFDMWFCLLRFLLAHIWFNFQFLIYNCECRMQVICCLSSSCGVSICQVTMHGHDSFPSRFLYGAELADVNYLKKAAASFPSPPPLSQTKDYLQRQVQGSVTKQWLEKDLLGNDSNLTFSSRWKIIWIWDNSSWSSCSPGDCNGLQTARLQGGFSLIQAP